MPTNPNPTSNPQKLAPAFNWIMSHIRAFLYGLGEMWRAPLATIMTLLVIGIAIALPSGLYVVLQNFQRMSQNWQSTPSITLYLSKEMTNADVPQLIQKIQRTAGVANVKYISPEQGLKEFEQIAKFGNILTKLNSNPIPSVLVVTPTRSFENPNKLQDLLLQLKNIPQVSVGQIDLAWVKRLFYIITIAKRITYAMALIFAIGVILIIGNTIRLTTQHHRQEINVLKLVGATYAFIRRPLLYRGILYGLFGSMIAWGLIALLLVWLHKPAALLAASYNDTFMLYGLTITSGCILLLCGAVFGWIGSFLAVNQHLKAAENA